MAAPGEELERHLAAGKVRGRDADRHRIAQPKPPPRAFSQDGMLIGKVNIVILRHRLEGDHPLDEILLEFDEDAKARHA